MRRISLYTKLNALSISLILMTAVTIMSFVTREEVLQTEKRLIEHSRDIANIIARSVRSGIQTGSRDELKNTIDALALDDQIAYVAVLNRTGNVLYSKSAAPTMALIRSIYKSVLVLDGNDHVAGIPSTGGESQFIDILVPALREYSDAVPAYSDDDFVGPPAGRRMEVVGYVRILVKRQRISEHIQRFLVSIVGLTTIVTLIGIGLTLLFTRRITSPLHSLVEATVAISKGNFQPIETGTTRDELNELAVGFNQMLVQLEEYRRQIDQKAIEARRAQEEALLASKAKSQFLANMSHEIRTPLTAIIGYAETLLEPNPSHEERLKAISTIIRSGKHLLDIINDILDLSKIEAERVEIEKIEISPVALLEEIGNLVRMKAEEKGLTFGINYQFPLPATIVSDPIRIKQVLLNLISNAIKFTDSGYVYVNVSCAFASNKMCFEVVDSGIGLTEQQIEKIFTKFTQADASTTRQYGGTGLGLALSRELTELLGGNLTVTSQPGAGSTFRATIDTGLLERVELVHAVAPRDRDDTVTRTAGAGNVRFTGTVLLAEDNLDNQQLISLWLRKMGLVVRVAENGRAAVEMARREPFDLVLMDMQMPVMSGIEAVESLIANGCPAPVIALTANAMKEDRDQCLRAGCREFITKPVSREQLQDLVSRYLPSEKVAVCPEAQPIRSLLLDEEPGLEYLVERFISRLPQLLQGFEKRAMNGDWEELRREIHQLKGSGGAYGFPVLTDLACRIETALERQRYAEVGNRLAELRDVAARICGSGKLLARPAEAAEPA